jgi:hypothetical protein
MPLRQCPPGIICFSPSTLVFMIFLIIALFGIFYFLQQNAATSFSLAQPQQAPPVVINQIEKGGDDRYSQAPLPLRQDPWLTPTRLASAPALNIPTRGFAPDYKPMGTLKRADGTYLPLYGRPTTRSDRFNYYTRTDTYNPVPLPLEFKKRNCMDDVGCNEIMSGEELRIAGEGHPLKVSLYNTEIPVVL